jgi:putative PIN family toxin of toxin-antitoxin system
VIDTNIAVSALLWGGRPRELLRLAANVAVVQMFSSPALIAELQRVMDYPKLQKKVQATGLTAASLTFHYRSILTVVEPPTVPNIVERDPDDNQVVAAAIAARADAIISGDDDLLALGEAAGVPVLSVAQALALFV